jgi:hypothetical protein
MAVFCPLHPNRRSCFSYPSPIYCGNRPSRHTILRGKEGAGLVMYDVYWLPMQLVTGFPVTVHSNQMILMIVRRERWTAWAVVKGNSRGAIGLEFTQIRWFSRWPGREAGRREQWGQKTLKAKINMKGNYHARVCTGSTCGCQTGRLDHMSDGQRHSNENWKNDSRQPRDLLNQAEWQP